MGGLLSCNLSGHTVQHAREAKANTNKIAACHVELRLQGRLTGRGANVVIHSMPPLRLPKKPASFRGPFLGPLFGPRAYLKIEARAHFWGRQVDPFLGPWLA